MESKRVMVAWKDTRESRRALCDALPILRKAEQIVVTEICGCESEVVDSQRRLRDVAQYLSRQGVSRASGPQSSLLPALPLAKRGSAVDARQQSPAWPRPCLGAPWGLTWIKRKKSAAS
jgi:hypothetical protein